MSVTGATLDDVRQVAVDALVGQTLTGTYLTSVSMSEAANTWTIATGPRWCQDGGVMVRLLRSPSTGSYTRQESGGHTQRQHRTTLRIEVGVDITAAAGSEVNADLASMARQVVNLLEAAYEPQSGGNHIVDRVSYLGARPAQGNESLAVLEFEIDILHHWRRS